jgi:hypothetical protein
VAEVLTAVLGAALVLSVPAGLLAWMLWREGR